MTYPVTTTIASNDNVDTWLPGDGRTTTNVSAYLANNAVFNVTDYGAVGDGTTPDTTSVQAAITAAQAVNGVVYVPIGNYKVTNLSISGTVTICGSGEASQLTVGANNAVIGTVTGSNVVFRNLQLVGDGTSTSSSNGCGIYLSGNRMVCEDVLFTGFGFGGISGVANALTLGPKLFQCRFVNNGISGGTGCDVYMGGAWHHSTIEDCDFSTMYAASAILFFNEGNAVWYDVQIRGGSVDGYQKYGIVCDDELWDGSDRVYGFLVDGVSISNVQWEGIKCKVSQGIRIANCFLDNCSQVAESAPNGLYGSILVNSLNRVIITGNLIRNSGCDGIRVSSAYQYPDWNPAGQACSQFTIANNIIVNPGTTQPSLGNGITAINPIKQLVIANNSIRGATLHAIQTNTTAALPMWDVGIFNNSCVDNPTTSYAINASYATTLRMDGNICQNSGGNVVGVDHVNTVVIGSSDMAIDPVIGPTYGYRFDTVNDLTFSGKCGNTIYPAWTASTIYSLGVRVYNSNGIYQCVIAGTSASSGGPTGIGPVTDGSVTWYYVGYHKGMAYGLVFAGTNGTVIVGDDAEFKNVITAPISSAIPSSYRRANIASGSVTFAGVSTATVTLPVLETDAAYKISLCGFAAETFWVTSKTTTGFTIHSSNATSTAAVDWVVSR